MVVRYGNTTAVNGLDLVAHDAEVTAILGPNGAGKTSTIETCEGYRRPTAGTVRVLGLDPVADAAMLRPQIGVMLQSGGVPSGAKAAETLNHFASFYANPQRPAELLDLLGLANLKTPFRRMSGGEQQRLKFAIALIGRPRLVFLDEPTAGLDAHAKRIVWDVVSALRSTGVSVILSTHLMDDVEQLADQVYVINRGAVVAAGAPAELTASSTPRTAFRANPGLSLVGLVGLLPPGVTAQETAPGNYEISGLADAEAIGIVSTWSRSEAISISDITTGRRRLEDVFLDLTGESTT